MGAAEQNERVRAFVQAALGADEKVDVVVGHCTAGRVQDVVGPSAASTAGAQWARTCALVLTDRQLHFVRLKPAMFSTWFPPEEMIGHIPRQGLYGHIRAGLFSLLLTVADHDPGGPHMEFTVRKGLRQSAEALVAALDAEGDPLGAVQPR